MNQNLKISQVLLILALFGCLLFAKFCASSASTSISTFSYLHKHPNGSIYLKLNNQLYGFNQQGEHQKTIDLDKMQVQENSQTDFAFFSNGDLLLRQQIKENNFIENLQRYFRFKNPTHAISLNSQDGLFRCNTATNNCKTFTQQPLNLHGAFAIAIDWTTDQVIISDSNRHKVYLYSEQGEILDSLAHFKFPNQVEVVNKKVYIANTNYHHLSVFNLSGNRLADPVITESFDTRTKNARLAGEVWPASFLLLANQRWVINMNNGMAYGGIYVFGNQGSFIKKLQLPSGADPFEMIQMGEQILISDYSLDRIYLYSLEGKLQGEFNPPVFQKELSVLVERRQFYDGLEQSISIAFALFLIGGFSLAIYQQYQSKDSESLEQIITSSNRQEYIAEQVLHWVKPSPHIKLLISIVTVLCILLLLLFAITSWRTGLSITQFFMHTWKIQLLLITILLTSLSQLRRKIGITENTLIICSPFGSEIICPKSDIVSNDVHIVIGKTVFQVNQLYKLFSEHDVENHLYPAIKMGQQVGKLQMQALLNNSTKVRIIGILIVTTLVALYFYYGVFQK